MGTTERDEVRAALAEIRREQYKVAFVYASLDAACVALAVGLVFGVTGFSPLDASVAPAAFRSLAVPAPDFGTVAAVVAGLAAFLAEFGLRARRPTAERFEAANPEVAEALRTARDVTRADRTNPMVQALYADVLDRLGETSSVGLVNGTRLAATVALALVLSLASVQTAVVGLDLGESPAGAGDVGGANGDAAAFENRTSVELRDGDGVLGEETDVSAGSENLTASVGSSPGGEGEDEWNYDRDADADSDGSVEAERSGFASPERVEDADLVQRYARELEANDTDV